MNPLGGHKDDNDTERRIGRGIRELGCPGELKVYGTIIAGVSGVRRLRVKSTAGAAPACGFQSGVHRRGSAAFALMVDE